MVPEGFRSSSGRLPEGLGLGFQGGVAVIAAAVGVWLPSVGARLDSGTCAGSGPGLGEESGTGTPGMGRAAKCLCTPGMGLGRCEIPLSG